MASTFINGILLELLELAKDFNSTEDIDSNSSYFQYILIGIARREFPILHSIGLLANDPLSGDAILDLSRRVFEDMISIEFMLVKDKEKQAYKFMEYSHVERWLDLEYLKKLGIKSDPELEKQVEEDFLKVKPKFLYKKDVSHSWSKTPLEKMIEELVKEKVLTDKDTANLLQGYTLGNRKNHLSSGDVSSFLDKAEREKNLKGSSEIGTAIAIISYIRILKVYAEETNSITLVSQLDTLFSKLNV